MYKHTICLYVCMKTLSGECNNKLPTNGSMYVAVLRMVMTNVYMIIYFSKMEYGDVRERSVSMKMLMKTRMNDQLSGNQKIRKSS